MENNKIRVIIDLIPLILNRISESLRESFYCTAMRNADEATWNQLLQMYYDEDTPDSASILKALGCSRSEKILKKYLIQIK